MIKQYLKYIPYIIIIILFILLQVKSCENDKINKENAEKGTLLTTLNDSMKVIRNKNNELEYSKKSLQNDVKFLNENINLLSNNQKELVKIVNSNKNIIAAMRADMKILIEGINGGDYSIPNDTTIVFKGDSTNKYLDYVITVVGVKPSSNKPELIINKIELPNTTTVKFEWEKEKNYPVKGTIVNSNPYMVVDTLDSFIIPEIKKETIKPNGWQKIKQFTNKSSSKLILIGTGIIIGLVISII